MKLLTLALFVYSGFASACIFGPEKIHADTSYGFKFKTEQSDLCNQCNMITITAPNQYKDRPFSHGLFTLYSGGKILSRSIHTSINESGLPEFTGIVSNKKGVSYEISFEYGKGKCMEYQFDYKNAEHIS